MPLLQIDVKATDADGNVGTSTIEVEVAAPGPPAAALVPSSANVSPPPLVTPPPLHEPPGMMTGGGGGQGSSAGAATHGDLHGAPKTADAPVQHRHAAMGGERIMGDKPVQISGLGNATGHQTVGEASGQAAPNATRARRSQVLYKNTGGFR